MGLNEINELDDEFIDFITSMGGTYGFDLLSSKIFAILYLEPDELSMEEISKKTGYSLASISNALKKIGRTGFLNEIHKPKTKKLFFTLEKDFSKHMRKMIDVIRKTKIEPSKERLPGLIAAYKENIKKGNQKVLADKLSLIENYYNQILKMEKITEYIEKQI